MPKTRIPDDTPVEKIAAPFLAAASEDDPGLVHKLANQAMARLRRDIRRGIATYEAATQALQVVASRCGDENPATLAIRHIVAETEPIKGSPGRPKGLKTKAQDYRARKAAIVAERRSEREVLLAILDVLIDTYEAGGKE